MPAASPQREAVGWGLKLVCSDWRTSWAKARAKLPSIKTMTIRRVTGNKSVRLAGPHAAHPLPANMVDPALREFNSRLNHHIRLSLDTMREQQAGGCSRRCVKPRQMSCFADLPAHANPALARPKKPVATDRSPSTLAIGEP
ncbi:hypothetical protein [Mesorhizobium sp.]|uniref:hypothetical protein n=1 Tax=Mesorhizobium sp. TaxID=1871066 RepID=UPI0025796521|nr:hypothetical protein [Mesorhizobium sp.]